MNDGSDIVIALASGNYFGLPLQQSLVLLPVLMTAATPVKGTSRRCRLRTRFMIITSFQFLLHRFG